MASWISVPEDSDFSLHNLPYGVFSTDVSDPRIGIAIGNYVLDMKVLTQDHVFADLDFDSQTLEESNLNAYAGLGKGIHRQVRVRIQQLLEKDTLLGNVLRDNQNRRERALVPMRMVKMHLPMVIGDYTDFFVGLHHAQNCANILKPGSSIQDLCPSFFNFPSAYHGRASSIVVSGTPFQRPKGQFLIDGKLESGTCQKLDFEVEFAAFIGRGNGMGSSIDVDDAEEHIFGVVLMNDWSARDIQFAESTPLGPFCGKNFCTTISPWIVPLEALEPFRVVPKQSERQFLPYLTEKRTESAYNIPIRVSLQADSESYHMAECNANNVVFSFAQMLAHHTRSGCPMRTGDLIATGTLSGATRKEFGCFLELSSHGTDPYDMEAESEVEVKSELSRAYLEDGDVVEFTAQARGSDGTGNVGFGACQGKVLTAV